jgi:molecular chaperone GrpE
MGKLFDHGLHHAVTTVEKNDCENDTIVEEIKKGYMIGDSLLRPSQVIVTKKKENE